MNIRRLLARALALLSAAVFSTSPMADLARVGPLDTANGFPLWYQDLNGLVLDKCFPTAGVTDTGSAQQNACLLTFPGPYTFPTQFPDEFFYFRAVSDSITVGSGANAKRAVIVLALEGAFANGAPAAGDQMVFTRIRVTAGVPVDGTYTVTHPYGQETFFAVAGAGNRDIVFTEDVGVTAGLFTDALRSRFGPFLVAADSSGNELPHVTLNGAKFLADGVSPVQLKGGPFAKNANGTNYVMICGKDETGAAITLGSFGPNGNCAGTNLWTLTGRVHDSAASPIGTPLEIERATYARDAAGTRVDVHANATRVLATQQQPLLTMATQEVAPKRMVGPDALNRYFAQSSTDTIGAKPSQVTVTNSADTPPTAVTAPVTDFVTITTAQFDAAFGQLTVEAASSDKGHGSSPPPVLSLVGFPTAKQQVAGTFTVDGLAVAPATVTVQSEYGGLATASVSSSSVGTFAPGSPLATDDSQAYKLVAGSYQPVTVEADPLKPVTFLVLKNDVPASGTMLDPLSLTILAPGVTPALGTAVKNADGTVTFTPGSVAGTASFKYTVNAVGVTGASNPATVNITLVGAAAPVPTANPDGPVNVAQNQSTAINVLANDNGNGGTLDPATVSTSSVQGGTTAVNPTTGAVSFTAGATAGVFGFDYTVANTNGRISNTAHVTVNVVSPNEVLAVAQAECRRSKNRWRVSGTSNITTAHTVDLLTTDRVLIGSSPVDALGAFAIDVISSQPCPGAAGTTSTATLRSSIGPKDFPIPVINRN